jgi:hypothetical protein
MDDSQQELCEKMGKIQFLVMTTIASKWCVVTTVNIF